MSSDSIGLSGLQVSQRLIDLTGQNITNAGTPGFHRQVADLAMRTNGGVIGQGVEIQDTRRIINQILEDAITRNNFQSSDVTSQLNSLQQIEGDLNPSTGSIHDLVEQFFNQVEQLSGQPADPTQRGMVVSAAQNLTQEFKTQFNNLETVQGGLDNQLSQEVDQVNQLAGKIANLNQDIAATISSGGDVNDLSDQRDQLISQLSKLVDVRVVPQDQGMSNVLAAGVPLVLGTQALPLQYSVNSSNQGIISTANSTTPLTVSGGQLGGDLTIRNQIIPDLEGQLNSLAQELAGQVDGIQATGLGLNGPFTNLTGQRAVSNSNLLLSQAGLAFPPQAGSLFVSVTDLSSGKRTITQLNINPATQTLKDVATAINGVNHLQALVDPQTNELTILAQPGFAFDFAGQLPTDPQNLAVTGTSVPTIGGTYTGSNNDNYTFKVVGSGTVGVTPNLTLQALDSTGSTIATWNIGQGYQPGSSLPAINGVTVSLSSGTLNNGDSFTTPVVSQPDTAGILTALGLNTFFTGDNAGNLQVSSALTNNPNNLAASRSGDPGDGANLNRLAALRDQNLLNNGTQTFSQFFATMTANLGSQVQDLQNQQTAQKALGQQLSAQQQSASGVDPNEELVNLLQYQRSYQFSARYLSLVNDTINSLLQMI